ncbi:deaminase domain-containing protein [Priestia megaterium]
MIANCIRKNYTDTSEGQKLIQIASDWYTTINNLHTQRVIGQNRYDELVESNFAAAIVHYGKRSRLKIQMGNKVIGNIKLRRELICACSSISTESKKQMLKHKAGAFFLNRIKVKKSPNFTYFKVNEYRSIGLGINRDNDSEAKLLETISNKAIKFGYNQFTVHLFTEYEPCLCCDKVIIDFAQTFPKSSIYIYYAIPYNELIL